MVLFYLLFEEIGQVEAADCVKEFARGAYAEIPAWHMRMGMSVS
jgi:hypothetical protein